MEMEVKYCCRAGCEWQRYWHVTHHDTDRHVFAIL